MLGIHCPPRGGRVSGSTQVLQGLWETSARSWRHRDTHRRFLGLPSARRALADAGLPVDRLQLPLSALFG